jgi:F420H(2)-dependent quinone reductase
MTLEGDYEPSAAQWARDQVELYERTKGQEGNTLLGTGLPIVIVTMRGYRSGKVRKTPVMRVEHDGRYAIVASKGGAPTHPDWYFNLKGQPDEVLLQDGDRVYEVSVREVDGEERQQWWDRAVAAYPPYAEYQQNTQRRIPVFVTSPRN